MRNYHIVLSGGETQEGLPFRKGFMFEAEDSDSAMRTVVILQRYHVAVYGMKLEIESFSTKRTKGVHYVAL